MKAARFALLGLAATVAILEPLYTHPRETAPGVVCAAGECDRWFAMDLWIPFVLVPVVLGLAWATDIPPPRWFKVIGTGLSAGLSWLIQWQLNVDAKIPEAGPGTTYAGGLVVLLLFVPLAYLLIGLTSFCGSTVLRALSRPRASTSSKTRDT